jgi:hypothetical protein
VKIPTINACAIQIRPKAKAPLASVWPKEKRSLAWAWVSWSYEGRGKKRQAFVGGFVAELTEGDEADVFFRPELAKSFAEAADRHFNFDEAARGGRGKWEKLYEIRIWEDTGT